MNFQNDRYTLRPAAGGDDEGIRRIFESGSFKGGLDIRFLRNPSPLASFGADGEEARILVIDDNREKRTAAVGGAVVRTEYVNGRKEKCAYLTGLKLHPDYQRRISFLPQSYRFLRERLADCRFFYTTVLDSNRAAVRLFEKKHRNMPEYRYLGHYTTYCFHDGRRLLKLERDETEGFGKLMQSHFSAQSLVPADYNCRGFGKKHFYAYRENGEIAACCFVGDQRESKQYEMCSYGGIYRLLYRLPTQYLGYPPFPQLGKIIPCGIVSYLYVKDSDVRLGKRFLRSVAAESGFPVLLWGGFENNPLCRVTEGMKAIQYGSRLYSVDWGDSSREEISGVIGMEAALL